MRQVSRTCAGVMAGVALCLAPAMAQSQALSFTNGGIDQYVGVEVRNSQLILTVSDAGPGIDPEDRSKINDPGHLGLRGIRERVESLGGDFHVTSNLRNTGVKLIAALPFTD